jgi:hypothetical protein
MFNNKTRVEWEGNENFHKVKLSFAILKILLTSNKAW